MFCHFLPNSSLVYKTTIYKTYIISKHIYTICRATDPLSCFSYINSLLFYWNCYFQFSLSSCFRNTYSCSFVSCHWHVASRICYCCNSPFGGYIPKKELTEMNIRPYLYAYTSTKIVWMLYMCTWNVFFIWFFLFFFFHIHMTDCFHCDSLQWGFVI